MNRQVQKMDDDDDDDDDDDEIMMTMITNRDGFLPHPR